MRDHSDPLHKVTIIPRGMALGVTMHLPEEDKHTVTRDYLETQLAMMMGGRCAEEIFLKQMTTGAGNDIERATELARAMVCEYGMSELGPMTFGKKEQEVFLGREIGQARDFSDDTAKQIDAEVRRFVDAGVQVGVLDPRRQPRHHAPHGGGPAGARDAGCGGDQADHRGQGTAAGEVGAGRMPITAGDDTQKVLKPEAGRKPGFSEGQASTGVTAWLECRNAKRQPVEGCLFV